MSSGKKILSFLVIFFLFLIMSSMVFVIESYWVEYVDNFTRGMSWGEGIAFSFMKMIMSFAVVMFFGATVFRFGDNSHP